MARVPIESFVGFTSLHQPFAYLSDGSMEAFPDIDPSANAGVLRAMTWGDSWKNKLWSQLRMTLTFTSNLNPGGTDNAQTPILYNRSSIPAYIFGVGNQFANPFGGFTPGATLQHYNSLTSYTFTEITMTVVGHRIPFTLYYTVKTYSPVGGTHPDLVGTLGSEQSLVFSRDAGWSHTLNYRPAVGDGTDLVNVRMSPV